MQRPTAKYKMELRESCGRMGDRFEGTGGVMGTTRKSTESTKPGLWGLTEIEPPIKGYTRAGPNPLSTYVAEV